MDHNVTLVLAKYLFRFQRPLIMKTQVILITTLLMLAMVSIAAASTRQVACDTYCMLTQLKVTDCCLILGLSGGECKGTEAYCG